ncbi:DUF5994 family protein [Microbacterium sp. ARD31]|uniref:DUF5994 family protein n=1 Tax=Microbacterium sp. ARD31 TaxID=2962576 RepID=UPI0028819270|nr:DUF5994 family protein [Microbacterium sp. ARD31]MDT0185948.1 DUF5994 family protein [Microbacterium sp. ARD31]
MTTSNGPTHPSDEPRGGPAADVAPTRGPLRLALAETAGSNRLDGAWWPWSRDPEVEVPDLVDHFPSQSGRVVRVLISPPDWGSAPRQVRVAQGFVKIGSFPRDDTHLVHLTLSDRSVLHLLVVPPGFTDDQGGEALMAAATAGNAHSAAALLEEVMDSPDHDPRDQWTDHGDTFWTHSEGPPSFRTGG